MDDSGSEAPGACGWWVGCGGVAPVRKTAPPVSRDKLGAPGCLCGFHGKLQRVRDESNLGEEAQRSKGRDLASAPLAMAVSQAWEQEIAAQEDPFS